MIFVSASSGVYVFNYNLGWIYVKKMNSWKLIRYMQKGFTERKITSKSRAKLKKPYFKMVYDNTIKNNCKSSNEEKEIYYEQFYL